MRRIAGIAVALCLTAPPAGAVAAAASERETFQRDNMIFTLYHESAHALLDLVGPPILGREEDAADIFAALYSVKGLSETEADALIDAAASSFEVLDAWEAERNEAHAYWAEHGLDMQRALLIVCHHVGADPDALGALASDWGIPPERADGCGDDRTVAQESWDAVLEGVRGGRFTAGARAPSWLRGAMARLNALAPPPRDVAVLYRRCGEADAYYDPETREIVLCAELFEEFGRQFDWMARR